MATYFELKFLSGVKVVFGGKILEFSEEGFQYRPPVFLSDVKFDLLYCWVELQLRQLKGDFGKYKNLTDVNTKRIYVVTFGNNLNFMIDSENGNFDPTFEENAIINLTNFMQHVGLYHPSITIAETVLSYLSHKYTILKLVPTEKAIEPPIEPVVGFGQYENDPIDVLLNGFSLWPQKQKSTEYVMVFDKQVGCVGIGYFNPLESNHGEVDTNWVPLRMMEPTPSIGIATGADVLAGISTMGTLAEHGYSIWVSSGIGDVHACNVSKVDLKNIASLLTK